MLLVFVPSKLEKITNYHIVVDQIQTHENAQGKPEADKYGHSYHFTSKKKNLVFTLSPIDTNLMEESYHFTHTCLHHSWK